MAKSKINTDDFLLSKYLETGDLEILGELFERYMHLVYGVCLRYFKNREDSKDAVMQIFEKLIHEIPKHDIKNFKSWLYVVTKNYCLMQIRAEKLQSEHQKKFVIEQDIFMESMEEMHPMDEKDANLNEALKECIEKLKEDQKKCVEMFYFQDKCYQEIGQILRIEEKKVKSYLQNGKRNLKICLENKNVRSSGT